MIRRDEWMNEWISKGYLEKFWNGIRLEEEEEEEEEEEVGGGSNNYNERAGN